MALYDGIESSININNVISDYFPVYRSVRQGCPMSMSLFILFQEPFYRAIIASQIIRPVTLPDATDIKILGYADDSTLLITDELSLIEVFKLISKFEKAMGSRLNKSKTRIFGTGNWKNRTQWPINELQIDSEYFYAIGIYHSNDYTNSVNKNWNVICENLKMHTNILLKRKVTLHQRATYEKFMFIKQTVVYSTYTPSPRKPCQKYK